MVITSVADPGCSSRILDPNFSHLESRIRIKEFKYFNPKKWFLSRIRIRFKEFKYFKPKKWFLSSRKYDPGCSSRIRIRNTGDYQVTTCHRAIQRKQRFCTNIHAWLLGPDLDQDSESESTNAVELGSNPYPIQVRNAVLFLIQIGFRRNFATKQNTGAKGLCWLLPRDDIRYHRAKQ